VLGKEDFMVIQALVRRGVYVCDIARQLGVHPKTVSRALTRGDAPIAARQKRTSLLDPYRAHIDQLLAEGVWNAQVIFREVQARGYTRKASILRAYILGARALDDPGV
jgi:transposase